MKLHLLLLLTLLLTGVPSVSSVSSVAPVFKDDITKELITFNGKTRAYYLYVPSTLKAGSQAPLIVTLHGSNRTGITLVEKWKDYAKKEGIIIAGPDSNNLRGWSSPVDGPDYLHALVEELKTKYAINPRRVYLFGHSAGASFALHMSLMESQYFAATAIHAGALNPEEYEVISLAKRKIPINIQVGDSDQLVPLKPVRATRDALKAAEIPVELIEIPNHDHWYYDSASKFNQTAWEFLKKYELDAEPQYQKYNWN
ncbi:MAG TPA: PHB depolymerase family esterase [Pyrinomonadaceae bacterium]|nr:PHB depolymerase family esterase [Pyrinomonadaceae bacterium]